MDVNKLEMLRMAYLQNFKALAVRIQLKKRPPAKHQALTLSALASKVRKAQIQSLESLGNNPVRFKS